jgi:hypothetical protein
VREKAIKKINDELKSLVGGRKEKAVSTYVAKTLKDFCKEEDFAQAVVSSEKTISDCCKKIMEKCGNHISDFEVYKKAAQFYFPKAKVTFTMDIDINGTAEKSKITKPVCKKKSSKKNDNKNMIQISLFD